MIDFTPFFIQIPTSEKKTSRNISQHQFFTALFVTSPISITAVNSPPNTCPQHLPVIPVLAEPRGPSPGEFLSCLSLKLGNSKPATDSGEVT
ncbi:hypothetical protein E2C01_004449 [Portunus trituberculatus]|uniref:Uncharacterized protein n=1 Tax=Portunus trituberculatus TaxID=210409 RepID=A0A5B7CT09_PORTR|nr:hypothetical protein [Portunus trituberculatus]